MTGCDEPSQKGLTDREKEVLQLIAEGDAHKQIVIKLGISKMTVKIHLSNIYKKLDARNAANAVYKYFVLRSGL